MNALLKTNEISPAPVFFRFTGQCRTRRRPRSLRARQRVSGVGRRSRRRAVAAGVERGEAPLVAEGSRAGERGFKLLMVIYVRIAKQIETRSGEEAIRAGRLGRE
jgi:hypothetical protein